MTEENIHGESLPTLVEHNLRIEANIPDLKLTFHVISPEQIDAYTDMGFLFDISATFFGISVGSAIGFWTALKQGGMSPESVATINTALYAAGIFGIVALAGALWFFYRKQMLKKQWRTSTLHPGNVR